MDNFTKVVRLGTTIVDENRVVDVFAEIKYKDGELSICGVEGPKANGDAWGSCGQILLDPHEISPAPGWVTHLGKFQRVWERWHLNKMRAGSPAQSAYLREHSIEDQLNWYSKACDALTSVGLNPDPNFPYYLRGVPQEEMGYKYGSAWLHEDVPTSILNWLRLLPDTDKTPAWV